MKNNPATNAATPELQGSLWFAGDTAAFAADQVRLLDAIDRCGSISAAAKAVGISYKTAWDRIETINNMSDHPLLDRTAGGAKGGGSRLTDYGRKVVEGFHIMEEEHEAFVRRMGSRIHALQDIANFMRTGMLRTSARNQYRGTVAAVIPGAVNAEIKVSISDSQTLTVIITEESRQLLDLQEGKAVTALIKAPSVLVSRETNPAVSAENKLAGRLARIVTGAVNSDVVIDLGNGKSISAIITNDCVTDLGLKQGEEACAFFKASSVILMAD